MKQSASCSCEDAENKAQAQKRRLRGSLSSLLGATFIRKPQQHQHQVQCVDALHCFWKYVCLKHVQVFLVLTEWKRECGIASEVSSKVLNTCVLSWSLRYIGSYNLQISWSSCSCACCMSAAIITLHLSFSLATFGIGNFDMGTEQSEHLGIALLLLYKVEATSEAVEPRASL